MTRMKNDNIGYVISIALHLLIGFAFFLTTLELKPFDLDFTPVTFAPMSEIQQGGGEVSRKWGGAAPVVDLPKRPMLEESSPLLKLPESSRQPIIAPSTSGKPRLSSIESLRPGKHLTMKDLVTGEHERAPIQPIPIDDVVLFGQRSDRVGEQIAKQEVFTIEWDGPVRVKTSGILPEYPEKVNVEALVRLSFTVAPDGSVINVAPITKGQPALEKVSLAVLRTWRFNRLDRGLVQRNQVGEITFRFLLE